MSTLRERVEGLVATLDKHDLRRWMRMLKGDGSLDYLRCYCGEKIYEDSNEAMLGHIAAALVAEGPPAPDFALPEQRDLTPVEQVALRRVYAKLYKPMAAAPSLHKEGAPANPCERCGKDDAQEWAVENALWLRLAGKPDGMLCISCFDALAEQQGIILFWTARISKHSGGAGRAEPEGK